VKASLLLCDWAEVVQGKLFAQGMGWSIVVADEPIQMAIAVLIRVPYDQTNKNHKAEVRMRTEDGAPYPDEGGMFQFEFEIGRPPGMKVGQEQNLPFAAKLAGIAFPTGGYLFEIEVDNVLLDTAPFTAVTQGAGR
jgi:hypothetical protein